MQESYIYSSVIIIKEQKHFGLLFLTVQNNTFFPPKYIPVPVTMAYKKRLEKIVDKHCIILYSDLFLYIFLFGYPHRKIYQVFESRDKGDAKMKFGSWSSVKWSISLNHCIKELYFTSLLKRLKTGRNVKFNIYSDDGKD